jgi:aminoglycoside phosphotransferase (APT) family kinase protein
MGLPAWAPDRDLDLDTARSVIRAAFPDVDVTRLRPLGSGWEFEVFATTDGWAFRFPRQAAHDALFDRERPVLELVRLALPPDVALPVVERLGAPSRDFPYRFAGHLLIEGVAADDIPVALRIELARSMAAALGAIHAVSIDDARAAGVTTVGPPDGGALEWFYLNLESASTGRLAGILDWTYSVIGDAARDFVACAAFGGWDFVEQVLRHYPGRVDADFRHRVRYMAQWLSVIWLGEAVRHEGDVR